MSKKKATFEEKIDVLKYLGREGKNRDICLSLNERDREVVRQIRKEIMKQKS